jgi:xylose dehydrogenase (NAD/NADP)
MADKIRWGVISTADIARTAVIPAIRASRNGRVLAVASRDAKRARTYADSLGIERAYGSYEELLADPEIDAIYNPLPNDGHAPWSIAAARAHKPMLVEKPIALNAEQAQQMVDVFHTEGVLLAEAFMYRYHPQHARVRELLAQDVIGPLNLIDACFTYSMPVAETANIRLKPEMGGGGLMDVGCYCVNLCRMMAGTEPESVTGQAMIGAASKVDETFVGTLRFPGGLLAHFDCGIRTQYRNQYVLSGPQGMIVAGTAFLPPRRGPATIQVYRGPAGPEVMPQVITIPTADQYQLMVEDFADAVLKDHKVTYDPLDSVKTMRVLDALAQAARDGKSVTI